MRLKTALQLILLTFAAFCSSGCAGEIEKQQLLELKKIAAQTPLYSGFEKTSEDAVLKRGMVYFNTYYRSNAKFSEIEAFYTRVLADNGWGPPQHLGHSLIAADAHFVSYRRGDYVIDVAESEARSDIFTIIFIWDPQ